MRINNLGYELISSIEQIKANPEKPSIEKLRQFLNENNYEKARNLASWASEPVQDNQYHGSNVVRLFMSQVKAILEKYSGAELKNVQREFQLFFEEFNKFYNSTENNLRRIIGIHTSLIDWNNLLYSSSQAKS